MKTILLLLALSTQAYSQELFSLNCSHIPFEDIKELSISITNKNVTVQELGLKGIKNKVTTEIDNAENSGITLSEWNGYTRELHYSNESWYIKYYDECSNHLSSIVCE